MSTNGVAELFSVGDLAVALDGGGFMLDARQWSVEVAEALAQRNGISLTAEHWEIIHFVREYHEEYSIEPPMRALVKAVRERFGEERGNSRFLYKLFPGGPAKESCRYAGLPKPVSCM
jgi:tRNA 2-thiouridine synthesizing protein E